MYDTIWLSYYFPNTNLGETYKKELPNFLQNDSVGQHIYNKGYSMTAKIKNLIIKATSKQVTIKGSLCKYLHNDNLTTLTIKEVKAAITQLSRELHLNLEDAEVTRFDIASNFVMRYPVNVYQNCMGNVDNFSRIPMKGGLYYVHDDMTFFIYDKIKEMREKGDGKCIPQLLRDAHILRVEMRYKKPFPKLCGCDRVTAKMLYDVRFYVRAIDEWYSFFQKIPDNFKTEVRMEFDGLKDLQAIAVQYYVKNGFGGKEEMLSYIKTLQEKKALTDQQAFKIKKYIESVFSKAQGTLETESNLKELKNAIGEIVKYYR